MLNKQTFLGLGYRVLSSHKLLAVGALAPWIGRLVRHGTDVTVDMLAVRGTCNS